MGDMYHCNVLGLHYNYRGQVKKMRDKVARNVLETIVAVLYREGKINKELMKDMIELLEEG